MKKSQKHSEDRTHRCMQSNKGKDTKPELLLRKELWHRGLRYRKNFGGLVGKPDVVFIGAKIAVFVDGKMWHGYNWQVQQNEFISNREYWIPKIEKNIERDRFVNEQLANQGWHVMRFWDFEIAKDVKDCADKIVSEYNKRKGT